MDLGIKNRRALVFASSDGLGKAVAQVLAEEGAEVIISSRNTEKLEATAREVSAHSFIQCDLGDPGAAENLVKEAMARLGGIDILVTNAGGPPPGMFKDINDDQWQQSFQELFMSVIQAVRAVQPAMAEQHWGRIVMLTSVAGKEPITNLTISNALRAGVHGLMNTLSKELGPEGITVNAVLPTYTETDRLKQLRGISDKLVKQIPLGRLGQPDELAKLVAYLCSESAGFVSGQAIGFDGGSMQSI